mmetsp:Transcript_3504/g.3861  ORF Transcript_3504/g.3861 Transcript_3504/m.3861 type:complete len:201 (+) Transcript_3504:37-639(+)
MEAHTPTDANANGLKRRNTPQNEKKKDEGEEPKNTTFVCNICLDSACDPVVTVCGHLYCWPCIYRWTEVCQGEATCPVCKAGIPDKTTLIPIYGHGSASKDPRDTIPSRPTGQRPPAPRAIPNRGRQHGNFVHPLGFTYNGPTIQFGNVSFSAGLFPGFEMAFDGMQNAQPLTPAEEQRQMLSRMVLIMGVFIMLFILMF